MNPDRRRGPLKFRKKPVVIEAMEIGLNNYKHCLEWCDGEIIKDGRSIAGILLKTLEGNMLAEHGDYIIKGVQGEFYPCKPDIFALTYEDAS